MKARDAIVALAAALALAGSALSETEGERKSMSLIEDGKNREVADDRLEWFRDARFGMFVHFGLYSILGGEWEGRADYGEHIQKQALIPGDEYVKLAARFDPVDFDAERLVSLAVEAGMKYLVITTKHHEGFCLFDSKLTDYDIVDASPYGRDPMKDLAKACEKAGIKLGFYYSVKDWHHLEYPTLYSSRTKGAPDGFHGFSNPNADYLKYLDYLEGQVTELLTNYGPIAIIWFDWSGDANLDPENVKRAEEVVAKIRELQPNCLINDRLLGGVGADYRTPEQHIPGGAMDAAFEVCMTLNRSWGYKKSDHNWKNPEDVIFKLVDIVGKGGNYLLNVGPTGEGAIPQPSVDILKRVGEWMDVNSESVYGAGVSPIKVRWIREVGASTARPGKIYLHLFDWPEDRKIFLPRFYLDVKKAYMLADPAQTPLEFDRYRRSLMIHLGEEAPDEINSVLVVEHE